MTNFKFSGQGERFEAQTERRKMPPMADVRKACRGQGQAFLTSIWLLRETPPRGAPMTGRSPTVCLCLSCSALEEAYLRLDLIGLTSESPSGGSAMRLSQTPEGRRGESTPVPLRHPP